MKLSSTILLLTATLTSSPSSATPIASGSTTNIPTSNTNTLLTTTPVTSTHLTTAPTATSTPVSISSDATSEKSTKVTPASPATMCGGDTSSTEGVQAILDDVGPVDYLDIWLHSFWQHENGWLDSFWKQMFPKEGTNQVSGCGDIDGKCSPPSLCEDYPSAMAYYVFQSVSLLNSKMTAARSTLTYKGWIDSLTIDQIAKDFTPPQPDETWAAWIAIAFGVPAAIPNPIIGGISALMSSVFWGFSESSDASNAVDGASVKNTLSNMASGIGDAITQLLKDATGNGNSSNLPIEISSTLEYATSRFFDQPGILLDEDKDNSTFQTQFTNFIDNLEKKIVTLALNTSNYVLVNDSYTKQTDCTTTGQLWITTGDTSGCYYLATIESSLKQFGKGPDCQFDSYYPKSPIDRPGNVDADIFNKLTDTYKFDLSDLYNNIIDCNLNGDNFTIEATNKVNGVPRCFYAIEAQCVVGGLPN